MMKFLMLLAVFTCTTSANQQTDLAVLESMVRVLATAEGKRLFVGTAVVVAKHRAVTNCHVVRKAHSILVFRGVVRYRVNALVADPENDLCLLHIPLLDLPFVPLRASKTVQLNEPISIVAYPNNIGISLRRGQVIGIHEYARTHAIEVDSGFAQGTSGGGVFDQHGQLLGLATFFTRSRNPRFFAIAADRIERLLEQKVAAIKPFSRVSYWELGKFSYE